MMRAAIIVGAALLVAGCGERPAPSQAPSPSTRVFAESYDGGVMEATMASGDIGIVRDQETGCQYISAGYREPRLTPRLGRDGKPLCGNVQ